MDMFIADTHFGHAQILNECRQMFSSIEEMNEAIINNISEYKKAIFLTKMAFSLVINLF